MTFLDLYGTRLDTELASNDQTQLFTTVRRKQAVNDAQHAFARMTGATKRYASIAIVNGTAEYDLELIVDYADLAGAPSIKIVKAGRPDRYIQGLNDFPRKDPEQLDREYPGWRALTAATPFCWYLRDEGGQLFLGLVSPPTVGAGETWTLLVPYVADPPDMTANGDVPFTFAANPMTRLAPYHQALAHYAAAVLEPLRKNYSGRDRQMGLYGGFVAQYLQQQRQKGPDQISFVRDYYRNAPARVPDPRRWP